MKAFITGSQAYGTPDANSDIDIVMFVDSATKKLLMSLLPTALTDYNGNVKTFKSGKVHLIVTDDQKTYTAWATATQALTAMRPVSREQAQAAIGVLCGGLYDK